VCIYELVELDIQFFLLNVIRMPVFLHLFVPLASLCVCVCPVSVWCCVCVCATCMCIIGTYECYINASGNTICPSQSIC